MAQDKGIVKPQLLLREIAQGMPKADKYEVRVLMADAGVNVVIAEILGHSDLSTTKRYSHAMEESKREAVEKLSNSGKACRIHAKKENGKRAGLPKILKSFEKFGRAERI